MPISLPFGKTGCKEIPRSDLLMIWLCSFFLVEVPSSNRSPLPIAYCIMKSSHFSPHFHTFSYTSAPSKIWPSWNVRSTVPTTAAAPLLVGLYRTPSRTVPILRKTIAHKTEDSLRKAANYSIIQSSHRSTAPFRPCQLTIHPAWWVWTRNLAFMLFHGGYVHVTVEKTNGTAELERWTPYAGKLL